MSKEGTFEYQRDLYARIIIDIMVKHPDKFGVYGNAISTIECTSLVDSFFNERMHPKWIDILTEEYPDVFSLQRLTSSMNPSSMKLVVNVEAAGYLEV